MRVRVTFSPDADDLFMTGLPLPLGGNAIARRQGADHIRAISGLERASIAHGLAHRDDALAWLIDESPALDTRERMSEYLDMTANARTLDEGEDGRLAIQTFFDRAAAAGILPSIDVDHAP